MFGEMFGGMAAMFPSVFAEAEAVWPGTPAVRDDAGRIVTPATQVRKPCRAQVSSPTTEMRAEEGFLQTDMRLIIPSTSIDVATPEDLIASTVVVKTGPHAGHWEPQTANLDTAACAWTCRGRKKKA